MTQISNNLKNLPEETLTHISSYLSPRSALSLALTSSKLQPAAESRLLRILRISESDLYAPTYNAPTPPLPIVTTPTLVGRTDTETSGEGNRVVFHRALASRRVIRSFLVKLEMKNYRRGYVRELEFSMRHEIPLEFGSLMKLVQGSLERLVLSFPVHSSASLPMEGFTTLPRILLPLREFHALREVRLNISRGWTKSVLTILQVAPRLESLNVRGSPPVPLDPDLSPTRIYGQPQLEHTLLDPDSPRSVLTMGEVQGVQGGTAGQGGVERSGREEQNQRDQQQPQLDIWRDGGGWDIPKLQLRHLVVDGIQGLMSPILSRLIRSADQLEHLCLRDRSMLFSPPSDWNVLDAITSLPRLKRLDIPWTIHEFLEKRDWQGLEGVEEMRVAWDYVTLRSKSDKGTIFPRLSTIKKYTVEIVAYTPQWVYENVSQPWHHQMSALRTMACVLEKEIIHLPALQTVLCTSVPSGWSSLISSPTQESKTECGPIPVPADFIGIVVHRLVSSSSTSSDVIGPKTYSTLETSANVEGGRRAESRPAITVIRLRCEMSSMSDSIPLYAWQTPIFNTLEAPEHVILAALAAAGLKMEDLVPGDNYLSQKGWDVIDHWVARREMELSAGDG